MSEINDRKRRGPTEFIEVLNYVGRKPKDGTQNEKRHYSEVFSQDVAEWFAGYLRGDHRLSKLLPPEHPVDTNDGNKRLDISALDQNGYLSLDVSIKTFNFIDKRSRNYAKNYTGRFYELIGESFELHSSYPCAVLLALIFLPWDSCLDGTDRRPSSFGNAVKRFGKLAGRQSHEDNISLYELVFVAIFDEEGSVVFFNANNPPPRHGVPPRERLLSASQVVEEVLSKVAERESLRSSQPLPSALNFRWLDNPDYKELI
jgi:hypothetical protein